MDYNPPGSSVHGILQARNTGVGVHSLLQGICPTQRSNQVSYTAARFFTTEWPGKHICWNQLLKCERLREINCCNVMQNCYFERKWKFYTLLFWPIFSSIHPSKPNVKFSSIMKSFWAFTFIYFILRSSHIFVFYHNDWHIWYLSKKNSLEGRNFILHCYFMPKATHVYLWQIHFDIWQN